MLTDPPRMMQALVFAKHGSPSKVLAMGTIPVPTTVPAGHVLVKVKAASINPVDKLRVEGQLKAIMPEKAWPATMGYDVAGIVEKVGEGVTSFAVGDEVAARQQSAPSAGTCAEYAIVSEETLAKKPAGVSWVDAAAIGLAGETALQALKLAGTKAGSKVLITGGAGGVGTLAIQIARLLGAETIATTASAGEKADLCRELGADLTIDYKTSKFSEALSGYDVAFDTTNEGVGCAAVLAKGGKTVSVAGTPSVAALESVAGKLNPLVRCIIALSFNKKPVEAAKAAGTHFEFMFLKTNGADLSTLLKWVDEGKLKVVVDSKWSLAEAVKAADRQFSGRAKGKVVVTVE